MYEHYFQSSTSKVVSHKPVNLSIVTLAAGLKRTFTIAIKTSEDRIKRRLNKTYPLSEVYITSENDPLYMDRAKAYAAAQAEQAAAAQDPPDAATPVALTKAQAAHRHEQLNYIGSKEIFTSHPGGGIVCIKLRAADEGTPPAAKKGKAAAASSAASEAAEASHDGFLYSVETKGGKSLGRQKQRYILLKRSCIYSLLLPSDILVTKIETIDKHGETNAMKHWISSNTQVHAANKKAAASEEKAHARAAQAAAHGTTAAASHQSPAVSAALADSTTPLQFATPPGSNPGSNNSTLKFPYPLHTPPAPFASSPSPSHSVTSPVGNLNGVFNFLPPTSPFTTQQQAMKHVAAHQMHGMQATPPHHHHATGSIFSAPSGLGPLGVSLHQPHLQNLNVMLPSSNNVSPTNHLASTMMMHGSNGSSRLPSGHNSVVMSPALVSPANATSGGHAAAAAAAAQNAHNLNAHMIHQQIAQLQSMLQQQQQMQHQQQLSHLASQSHPSSSPPTLPTAPSPVPHSPVQPHFHFNKQLSPTNFAHPLNHHPQHHLQPQPAPRSKFDFHTGSITTTHPPFHPTTTTIAHAVSAQSPSMFQYPPFTHSDALPHPAQSVSPFVGGASSEVPLVKEEPNSFPPSPVLPTSMRTLRDRSTGLHHSFDSQQSSAGVSVHSSLGSLPTDTTRENSSAESSTTNSLRNSAEGLTHGLASQSFYARTHMMRSAGQFARHPVLHAQPHLTPEERLTSPQSLTPSVSDGSDLLLDSFKNPMSSAFWNPPNPNPPSMSSAHRPPSMTSVVSPDFLCADLFQGGAVPTNFFASPLQDSDTSSHHSGSTNGSPILPIDMHGRHADAHRPSAASLAAAMMSPAQAVGDHIDAPDIRRSGSAQSHHSGSSRPKRKKTPTGTRKKRRGSGSVVSERKLYTLSPRLWNLALKKPPFRSTLTIGRHTDKFKTSDKIQVRFGGAFLDASQVDQYKKNLLIVIPPPPNPAALIAAGGSASAAASGPLDLTHTSVEVDLELFLNDVRVFTTVFAYKFGGPAQELTTSSSSDDDDSESDREDESEDEEDDSMDDGTGHGGSSGSSGSSGGSPDRDRDGPDGNGGGVKRHKSWNSDGHGRTHGGGSGVPHSSIRLTANFDSIPLFATGVLKAYPLLNAGLQDLLQNYLLQNCLAQAEASGATHRIASDLSGSPPSTKRYVAGGGPRKAMRTSSRSSSSCDEEFLRSAVSAVDSQPSTPHAAYRGSVSAGTAAHTAARVTARMLFVQALTGADPLAFVHTALRACINSASGNGVDSARATSISHTSIDAVDSFGFTLLHYTVCVGDLALTELLLSLGASASVRAHHKHAAYAFTPTQLVQMRVAEEEQAAARQAAAQQAAATTTVTAPLDESSELSHNGKKKRRTSCADRGSCDFSSEDSTMSEILAAANGARDSPANSPVLSTSIPFSAHFASLPGLGTPATSHSTSIVSTPTNGGRTLFKSQAASKPTKSFHFGLSPKSDAKVHPHYAQTMPMPMTEMQLFHMQQQQQGTQHVHFAHTGDKSVPSAHVSSTATTAAPTPSNHASVSSPSLSWRTCQMPGSPAFGLSVPSTPMARSMPDAPAFRLVSDPKELNDQLAALFKLHRGSTTTDSSAEMSDESLAQVEQTEAGVMEEEKSTANISTTATDIVLPRLSPQMVSYLESRWSLVQQKRLASQSHRAPVPDSPLARMMTPLTLSDADKANQRELVMLELAMLMCQAQKQMHSLSLDLADPPQSEPVDITSHLSSPLQSLHIHTVRTLLSQYNLLRKYYTSYLKYRQEQDQVKALADRIGSVKVAADTTRKESVEEVKDATTAGIIATNAVDANTVAAAVETAFSLNDNGISAFLTHVSNFELLLRAHILEMQHVLAPYISRALAAQKKHQKAQAKQEKMSERAARVASAVNVHYTPSRHGASQSRSQPSSTAPHSRSLSHDTPMSAGYLSRTSSGRLSLNIVGSLHPDEDDEASHIEIREIHGVDPRNAQRIDLTLSDTIVAEESQAAAERTISRRLHQHAQPLDAQPLERIAEKIRTGPTAILSTQAHHTLLSVAPFPTPSASPVARGSKSFQYGPADTTSNAAVAAAMKLSGQIDASGSSATRGNRYALLIGINRYDTSLHLAPLLGCENDVARIGSALHQHGFDVAKCRAVDDSSAITFGPGERTHALLNSGATRVAIRRALASLVASVASPADSVFVYFAGHGFAECLIAFDGMLDYSEMTHLLAGLKTRDVSFVSDTCANHTVDADTASSSNAAATAAAPFEMRNTTLTLDQMRALVDSRDSLDQQEAAAHILAAISPNAPVIQVTPSKELSPTGYEGDEADSDESDADEPMHTDEAQQPTPTSSTRRFRGVVAFNRHAASTHTRGRSNSMPLDATESEESQPVTPVIQRLETSRGLGYFARGVMSLADPRASEVRIAGKWQGAYTAHLCAKMERAGFSSDVDPPTPNSGGVPLAQILFHDEDGGNLSGHDVSTAGETR